MPYSGYSGFLGIHLAHLAISCRHGLEKWPACRNRIEALLSRLVVHGSFRGSHHGPLSNLCVDHASHCACPVHGSSAGSVPFISKYGPHSQPAGNRLFLPSFPALLHSRLHVRLSGFTPLCSFNVPKLFRLILEKTDVARIIGRNGMTASAIRSLAKAAGEKHGIKVIVHMLSHEEAAEQP